MKQKLLYFSREYTVALMLLGIFLLMSVLRPATFLQLNNIMNVIRVVSIIGIMACGMTCVMIFSGFDLSIGMIMSFSGVMFVLCYEVLGPFLAFLAALFCGVAFGAVNGAILSLIKAGVGETFVITLGMQGVIYSLGMIVSNGAELRGSSDPFFLFLGKGFVLGIAFPIYVFVIIAILSQVILKYTSIGRRFYLIGGNKTAAKLSGIKVEKYRVLVFSFSGLCASIAGVILTSRTLAGSQRMGTGYEFDTISAIVIGGTSLFGGEGNILKTVFGVLLVSFLINALNLLGIANEWQYLAKGLVVVVAVWLDMMKKKKEGR